MASAQGYAGSSEYCFKEIENQIEKLLLRLARPPRFYETLSAGRIGTNENTKGYAKKLDACFVDKGCV